MNKEILASGARTGGVSIPNLVKMDFNSSSSVDNELKKIQLENARMLGLSRLKADQLNIDKFEYQKQKDQTALDLKAQADRDALSSIMNGFGDDIHTDLLIDQTVDAERSGNVISDSGEDALIKKLANDRDFQYKKEKTFDATNKLIYDKLNMIDADESLNDNQRGLAKIRLAKQHGVFVKPEDTDGIFFRGKNYISRGINSVERAAEDIGSSVAGWWSQDDERAYRTKEESRFKEERLDAKHTSPSTEKNLAKIIAAVNKKKADNISIKESNKDTTKMINEFVAKHSTKETHKFKKVIKNQLDSKDGFTKRLNKKVSAKMKKVLAGKGTDVSKYKALIMLMESKNKELARADTALSTKAQFEEWNRKEQMSSDITTKNKVAFEQWKLNNPDPVKQALDEATLKEKNSKTALNIFKAKD